MLSLANLIDGSGTPNKSKTSEQAVTTASNESFANCTELTKVYPNGVPSSHPAYQSKIARDKDGLLVKGSS
ncbi:excalibur calcium-binding domain-containing protein [Cytobacillus purgationiresistens]|uniref:Excalibur calcium-binding domain-containing protein n=1 Tax=Cytobacillus purgationiresistens TaxID=863449 RepID=A0ABU0ARY1_9BACI|nr:hypothetical protein [Cytobacillus purgationiresistens]